MRYHDRLQVKCRCGHQGSFSQAEVAQVFGDDATLEDIKRRLRCSACSEIGQVEVSI
jgi:hypothetical protein